MKNFDKKDSKLDKLWWDVIRSWIGLDPLYGGEAGPYDYHASTIPDQNLSYKGRVGMR